jgi:ABC-type sugar transport system ATPase subunit
MMADVERTALYAEDIHKSYAGIAALRGVTLSLRPGEVHALLGVEGAGKSTLVRILSGVLSPDAGRLYVDGRPVTLSGPHAAAALGIGALHHQVQLVPLMSIASNILLDYAPQRRFLLFSLIDWRKVEASAQEALDLMGRQAICRWRSNRLPSSSRRSWPSPVSCFWMSRPMLCLRPTSTVSFVRSTRSPCVG